MKKKVILFSLLLSVLVACSNVGSLEQQGEIMEMSDSMNHIVKVPVDPQQIGVFDNAQIDNMDALGLGERIVVTASTQLPTYLQEYSEVEVAGTLHEVDLEIAMSTQPDLAIVASRSSANYDLLAEFIPTVDFSLVEQNAYKSMEQNFVKLAKIFNKEKESDEILIELEKKRNELYEAAQESELTALMVMYNGGTLSAFGSASRFGHVYDDFGFTPVDDRIDASNHGMEITYEYIMRENPDIIFVLDRSSAISDGERIDNAVKHFEENPLIEVTNAYKNKQIHYLTPDVWYLSNGGVQAYDQMITDVWNALKD